MVFYPVIPGRIPMLNTKKTEKSIFLQDSLSETFSHLPDDRRGAIEEWVVNSAKVKMIKKLDDVLDERGKMNCRKLFLVPVFTIRELMNQVDERAPELRTFFYKELIPIVQSAEQKTFL